MICPKCKEKFKADATKILLVNSRFKCPKCKAMFVLRKQSTMTNLRDLVLQVSEKGTLIEFKGELENNLFISTDNIKGKNIGDVMTSDIAQPIMHSLKNALQTGDLQSFEYKSQSDGEYYELKFIANGTDKVITIISNISRYKREASSAAYIASHDALTGLPNRTLFNDRLNQAILLAEREKNLMSILFLDIDNFKHINDTFGHKAGDQLLRSVADRLIKDVRAIDSISHFSKQETEFTMARLGGDEFTIMLNKVENIDNPGKVAGRILKILSDPFMIGAHEVFISVSMGIVVYPFDGKDIDTLLINADVAMYQAKNNGKNNYQYYSESMNKFTFEKFTVESKLRKGLDHNEFMLFYQPQINICTGRLIGVEALIRWLQPDLVLTRPSEFIPLAEQTGLIIPMGEWVIRAACEQIRTWQASGINPVLMTVNISSIQIR